MVDGDWIEREFPDARAFDNWLNAVREQDAQMRRLRGMETATERLERLRTIDEAAREHLRDVTWHDWRSPGLRRDCTRLDGHVGACRRVSESLVERGARGTVILVEARVGARL